MKKAILVAAGIVAFIAFVSVMSFLGKGCDTASKMADQTVFNADKHVYSYEQFHKKYNAYQEYIVLYENAKAELKSLRGDGVKSDDPEYRNQVMAKNGAYQMVMNIVREYNAMSDIGYQGIWKSKGLPDKLKMPVG